MDMNIVIITHNRYNLEPMNIVSALLQQCN